MAPGQVRVYTVAPSFRDGGASQGLPADRARRLREKGRFTGLQPMFRTRPGAVL